MSRLHPYSAHLARLGIDQWLPRDAELSSQAPSLGALGILGASSAADLPFGQTLLVQLEKVLGVALVWLEHPSNQPHLVVYEDQLSESPDALASLEGLLHEPAAKQRLWQVLSAF